MGGNLSHHPVTYLVFLDGITKVYGYLYVVMDGLIVDSGNIWSFVINKCLEKLFRNISISSLKGISNKSSFYSTRCKLIQLGSGYLSCRAKRDIG